jgi:hypothetical protein
MEEYLQPLAMYGVSILGSSVQGWIAKHKTPLPNDTIPTQTGATWGSAGIGVGAATNDPLTMVAGFAGAVTASVGQKMVGKLFGKIFGKKT